MPAAIAEIKEQIYPTIDDRERMAERRQANTVWPTEPGLPHAIVLAMIKDVSPKVNDCAPHNNQL